MLGNGDVTKSQNVAVKPGAAVVPANTDKVQNAKKAGNCFLNSRCGNGRGASFCAKSD
jgi:hypothetical protein